MNLLFLEWDYKQDLPSTLPTFRFVGINVRCLCFGCVLVWHWLRVGWSVSGTTSRTCQLPPQLLGFVGIDVRCPCFGYLLVWHWFCVGWCVSEILIGCLFMTMSFHFYNFNIEIIYHFRKLRHRTPCIGILYTSWSIHFSRWIWLLDHFKIMLCL